MPVAIENTAPTATGDAVPSPTPAPTPVPAPDPTPAETKNTFVSKKAAGGQAAAASPDPTPPAAKPSPDPSGFVSSGPPKPATAAATPTPRAIPSTDFVSQKGDKGPDTSNFTSPNNPNNVPSFAQQAVEDQPTVSSDVAQSPVTAGYDQNARFDMSSGGISPPDLDLDSAIHDTASKVASSGRVDTTMGDPNSLATPEQVKALAESPKNLDQLAAQHQISQQTLDAAKMLRAQTFSKADPGKQLQMILGTGVQLSGDAFNSFAKAFAGEMGPLAMGGRGPLLGGVENDIAAALNLSHPSKGAPEDNIISKTTGLPVVTRPVDFDIPEVTDFTGLHQQATAPSLGAPQEDQTDEAQRQKDTRTLLSTGENLVTTAKQAAQAIAQNTVDAKQTVDRWLGMNPERLGGDLFNAYGLTIRGIPYDQMPLAERQAYNAARVKQIQDEGAELSGNSEMVNHLMDYFAKTSGKYSMSPLERKAYGQEVDPADVQAASLGAQILLTHWLPEIPGFSPLVDHLAEGAITGLRVPVRAADGTFKLLSAAAKNETALNVAGGLSAISTAWHALTNGNFDLAHLMGFMGSMGGAAFGAKYLAKSKAIGVFLDHLGAIAAKGDQFMATAADEASAGRPFFGNAAGDIGKWIPPWMRKTGEALMPSGSMALAGPVTRLGAGLLGQTARATASSALMAPAFTQDPEDAANMIGQMAAFGTMGAIPGAGVEAFHAPFDHLFTPKYGSLIPGKFGDTAPFRGFGTNWDGGPSAPFRPYGTDTEADRVDQKTISMFPKSTQNRMNNLRELLSGKAQVHVFDDQSMDNVVQAHADADAGRIDQYIASEKQAHSDALVRGDNAAAQTHVDNIQKALDHKANILSQPATGSVSRGFFFSNGIDGKGPMQAYVRHSAIESALGHEGLGHPMWNIMQELDARKGTNYAKDFLDAAKKTTNMDTFANDYVTKMTNGGVTDATYNNLPKGITQSIIDEELAAEHGAGLLNGAPASMWTKDPGFQRSLTMGVGSVLEHILGIPVTGLLARHEFDGFNGSVAAAVRMDQAIRAMSRDPNTVRPWQAKIEKMAKAAEVVTPDEAAARSLAKGGKFTIEQARDIIAKSKQQGSPSNNNKQTVKYTPAQEARAIIANPNAQGFTEDEAIRHVPDDASNIGEAVSKAREAILAERKAKGIPSPDEERAVKQAAQDKVAAEVKAVKDKASQEASAKAAKEELQNNLADPKWVAAMEAKHGLKPGSMVAADKGSIHANRVDGSAVTIKKGEPIQEGHVGGPKVEKGNVETPNGNVEEHEKLGGELGSEDPPPKPSESDNKPKFMPGEAHPEGKHEEEKPFIPSKEWQDIPDHLVMPNGGEYKATLGGGKQARWTAEVPGPEKVFDRRVGKYQEKSQDAGETDREKAFKYNAAQKNRPEGEAFVSYRNHLKAEEEKQTKTPSAPKVEAPEAPKAQAHAIPPPKSEEPDVYAAAASVPPEKPSRATGTVVQRPDGTWSLHVGSDDKGMTPHVRRFDTEANAKAAADFLRNKYGPSLMADDIAEKVWKRPPAEPKSEESKPGPPKPEAPEAPKVKPEAPKGAAGTFPESPGPGTEITGKGSVEHQPRKPKAKLGVPVQNAPNAPSSAVPSAAPAPQGAAPIQPSLGVLEPISSEKPKETTEHTVKHQQALVNEGHGPGKAQKIVSGEEPKNKPKRQATGRGTGQHSGITSLRALQPDFRQRVQAWIADMRSHGYDPVITETSRSRSYQAELYKKYQAGGSLAAPPGASYHEWGRAFDWVNRGKDGKLHDDDTAAYEVGREVAKAHELIGINNDNDHIQDARYGSYTDLPKNEYNNFPGSKEPNIGAFGYAGDRSWDHNSLKGIGAGNHVGPVGSMIDGYSAGLTKEGAALRGLTPINGHPSGQEFYGEDGNLYRWDDTAPSIANGHPVSPDYIDVYNSHHAPDPGMDTAQMQTNQAEIDASKPGSAGKRGPLIEGETPKPSLNGVEEDGETGNQGGQGNGQIVAPQQQAQGGGGNFSPAGPWEPVKNLTSKSIIDAEEAARAQVDQGTKNYETAVQQKMLEDLGAQHAASLAPGDTRVKYDPTSGYTTGTHFVTDGSDPFHDWLLKGQSPQVMDTLAQIQAAISGKKDLFFNYGSAVQKEGGLPTGGQRKSAQENAPATAREKGLADIQSASKNILPTYVGVKVGKNGEPNSVIFGGLSPDKASSNAAIITHALGPKSPYPVAPLGDNGVAEMDARGYMSNHANGWDGTGQKKLIPAPGYEDQVSQESPDFEPYNMSQKKSDFWNLAIQGKDAKLSSGKKAAAAFEMAKLNDGYSSQGYRNKLAHQLDMSEGPQPKMVVNPDDPTGPNIQAKDKNGKPIFENWTENKLHSGYEMLKAALTGKIHASGELADEPIHPGHPALTKAMQEKGLPNLRAGKAGFMPQDFQRSSPEDFIKARDKTTRAGYLSPLSPEDIKDHNLFVNKEGTVGAAVDPQGDVQNVFNNGGPKGAGADAVSHAIRHGGNTLDAFDDYLPKLYRQFGFQETGRMKFNPDYAPHGWNYAKDDNPDVVFMARKGYPPGGPEAAIERAKGDKSNWIKNEQTDKYEDDYDAAKQSSRRAVHRGGAEVLGAHGETGGKASYLPAETPLGAASANDRGLASEGRPIPIGDNQAEADQAGQGGRGIEKADSERLGAYSQALQEHRDSSDRIDRAFRQGGKPHSIDVAAEESAKQIPALRKLAESRGELLPPMDREPDAHGSEHQVWFSDDGKTATKETYYRNDPAHGNRKRFGAVPTIDAADVRDATPHEYLDRIAISNEMGRKTRVVGVVDQGNGETRIRTEEPAISDAVGHPSMDDISDYMAKRGFQPKEWTSWYNPETKVLASDAQPRNFLKTEHGIYPVDTMLRHVDTLATPLSDADRLKKNEQQRSHLEKQQAKLDTTKPEEEMNWEIIASKIHDLEREHQRLSESVRDSDSQDLTQVQPSSHDAVMHNARDSGKAQFMPGEKAAVRDEDTGEVFTGSTHGDARKLARGSNLTYGRVISEDDGNLGTVHKFVKNEGVQPAVKFPSGSIYTGLNHTQAVKKALKAGDYESPGKDAQFGHLKDGVFEPDKSISQAGLQEKQRPIRSPLSTIPRQKGQFMPGEKSINPDRVVNKYEKSGDQLHWVPTKELDQHWEAGQHSDEFRIPPGGSKNSIGNRYQGAMDHIAGTDKVNAPRVAIHDDGSAHFTDGRHTFSVMRDQGMTHVPIAIHDDAIQNAKDSGLLDEEHVPRGAKAQFMPGDIVENAKGERERIRAAAVRYNGKVYESYFHPQAVEDALIDQHGKENLDKYWNDANENRLKGLESGYTTNTRRFVQSAEDAWDIADQSGQLKSDRLESEARYERGRGDYDLDSYDLKQSTLPKQFRRPKEGSPIKSQFMPGDIVERPETGERNIAKENKQLKEEAQRIEDAHKDQKRQTTGLAAQQLKAGFIPDEDTVTTGAHGQNVRETTDYDKETSGDEMVRYREPVKAAFMPMAGDHGAGFKDAEREGRTFKNPYDQLPRYEISDHDMQWNRGLVAGHPQKLGDLIDHPKLFKDYPASKKIRVEYDPRLGYQNAVFDPNTGPEGLIALGDHRDKSSLVHEIQHWIQRREDFPGKGANVSESDTRLDKAKIIAEAQKEYEDKYGFPEEDIRAFTKAQYPDATHDEINTLVQEEKAAQKRAQDAHVEQVLRKARFDEYQRNAGEIEAREAAARADMTPEERAATPPYNPESKEYILPGKAHFLPPAKATDAIRTEYAETPERNKTVATIQKKAQDWLDKNPAPELSSHTAALSIPKGSKFSVEELADHLRQHYGKNMDLTKESHRAELASAVTHDIMTRLAEKGSGVGWYEVIPDAAIRYVSDHLDPSIGASPENSFMYKVALAIGSQGQSVYDNIETSYWAYKHWMDKGVLPTNKSDIVGGGKNINQIRNNFDKINRLIDKHGIQGTEDMLEKVATVKEMREAGLPIGKEDANHSMQGSLYLGPKVGAFHAALNKHFENLVMDLWFNRTMNRMKGDMFAFDESPFRKQANTVKDQINSGELSLPDTQRNKMLSEIDKINNTKKLTRQNLPKMAPNLLDWASQTHEVYRKTPTLKPDGTVDPDGPKTYGNQAKTPINQNAKNLDIGLHLLQDLPRDIPERQQYRDIIKRSLKELEASGIHMTVADAQSILWYSEQSLFDKGGALGAKSDTSDYLDAAYALVKQQQEHPGMPTPESRAREKAEMKAAKAEAAATAKLAKKSAKKVKIGPPVPSMAGT